jgi:hypothetical protein
MITIQISASKGWLHNEGGFCFDEQYYLDPIFRQEQDNRANQFLKKHHPEFPVYNFESNLVQADHYSQNQVLVGGIQPNMILGLLNGAILRCFPDKDADIDRIPLKDWDNIEVLPDPGSFLDHEIIKKFDLQILSLQKQFPEHQIIPPFFWDTSGRATIHGPITTALKLFSEKVFLLMGKNPKHVSLILDWITAVYSTLIHHFAEIGNITAKSIHIGECSGTMISGSHFSEYVAESVETLGDLFGKVRLHSCGLSNHLLEAFSEIKQLDIIDTGSNTSLQKIRAVFGNDFEVHYAPPIELLQKNVGKKTIVQWIETTLEENSNGPLKINFHLEAGYDVSNCITLYQTLLDIIEH